MPTSYTLAALDAVIARGIDDADAGRFGIEIVPVRRRWHAASPRRTWHGVAAFTLPL